VSVIGCGGLIVIGMQPPNEKAVYVVAGMTLVLAVLWFAVARRQFPGPPQSALTAQQQKEIHEAEVAAGETGAEQ
jgi:hypothetical protein